jgi:hypothetical protein
LIEESVRRRAESNTGAATGTGKTVAQTVPETMPRNVEHQPNRAENGGPKRD